MSKDVDSIGKLIYDFSSFIDKRPFIFFLGVEEVFSKILEWNYSAWRFCWSVQHEGKPSEDWIKWRMISDTLNSVINRIGERAIQERQDYFTYIIFACFKKHVLTHYNDSVSAKNAKRYYLIDLFRQFRKLIFDKVQDSSESREFWTQIPNEWKVTKANLTDPKNLVARIMCNEFMEWMTPRIYAHEDFDMQLNTISTNFFPEVNTETWAIILIFSVSSFGENRIQSMIERRWNFGFPLPVVFVSQSPKDAIESMHASELQQTQNAYELALLLFPDTFNEVSLKEFIRDAAKLTYAGNSKEEHKRLKLLEIFEGILKILG